MEGRKQTVYLKVKNLNTTMVTYLNMELVNKLMMSPDSGNYQIVDEKEYLRSKNGTFHPREVKNAAQQQAKETKKNVKTTEPESKKEISELVETVKNSK